MTPTKDPRALSVKRISVIAGDSDTILKPGSVDGVSQWQKIDATDTKKIAEPMQIFLNRLALLFIVLSVRVHI